MSKLQRSKFAPLGPQLREQLVLSVDLVLAADPGFERGDFGLNQSR